MSTFKKCKVVMLPSEKAENALIKNMNQSGSKGLLWKYKRGHLFTRDYLKSVPAEPFHLYITLEDFPEKGKDVWYIDRFLNKPRNSGGAEYGEKQQLIIATTDMSLKIEICHSVKLKLYSDELLPQPSESFIEKYVESYNKGEEIIDVLVEYFKNSDTGNNVSEWEDLKINPKDNSITIRKVKNSWNREELEIIIQKFDKWKCGELSTPELNTDWLNKNLDL